MAAYLATQSMLFACVFLLHVFHHNAVVAQTVTDVADDLNTNLLTPHLSTPGEKVDLVFVVDQSAFSEDKVSRGFLYMINFVKEILSGFTVDTDHTRVSLITYSTGAAVRINDLDSRYETKCTVFSRLDEVRAEVPQNRGLTATTDALRQAKQVLMDSRSDAKKAVILITDSYSTIGAPPAVASAEIRSLRWAGWNSSSQGSQLEVFAVGVNGADEPELESVASSSPTNVFNIDSFSSLRQVSKLIHKVPENSSWEVTRMNFCGQCDISASCACDTGLGQYHCVCDPGYHGDGRTCQACPVDTYKDSIGPGTCTACPGNTTSTTGATSVEECEEVLCPALPSVPHATSFHIYSPANEAQVNTFTTCKNTPGDFCYFQCEEGFNTSDVTRLYCDGTSWDRNPPTCEVVECGSITPTALAGMTVTYNHSMYGDHTYGTVATITCEEGYRTYGSTERTCTEDGAWNGTMTKCQPTECPSLVPPAYGQITPANCSSKKPEYQTVCTYSCDAGFQLAGPSNRTCQSNDLWTDSGVASTCNDVQPPSIVCPRDRTLYSDDGNKKTFYWNNDEPMISDNSGFHNSYTVVPAHSNPHDFLVGIHTLTYKVTDAAGNEASCERQLIVEASQPPSLEFCPRPGTTTITVTTTTGALNWTDPVYHDADNNTVTTECDRTKGESASLGTHNIHCNAQGYAAVNLCSFQVILKAPECNIPADPLHGSSSCTATASHQERCTVSCDAGYSFAEDPESQYLCSYSGEWTPEPNWPNCAAQAHTGITTQTNTIQYDLSADSCNETVLQEIKSSFNSSFFALAIVQTQCANHECSLPEINVTCDTARRRRDVSEKSPMSARRQLKQSTQSRKSEIQERADLNDIESGRKKRATDFVVTIVFVIRVEVPAGETVSASAQSALIDIQDEVYFALDDVVTDGSFDITIIIAGVTLTCDVQTSSYVAEDPVLDTTCGNGQVSKQPSDWEAFCVNCPVGSYKSGDSCVLCPHGQYQDQEAQQECLSCPEGTDTTGMGAVNITECRKFCSPGNYSSTGLEDCTPCEVGSYQPTEKSTSCEQCSSGTSTEAVGSTSEDDCKVMCPSGSSSPTGVVPCGICTNDTYQPETGQQKCVPCPNGYKPDASGATSQSDCKAHQLYVLTITLVITYNLDLQSYNENFVKMFEATSLAGEMTVTENCTSEGSSSSRLTTCTADHAVSPSEVRPSLEGFRQAFHNQLGTGQMGDVPASTDNFTIAVKDPCSPDPCINGTCQEDPDSPLTGYECICTAGFTGTDCEIDINECAQNGQNPCQHDSTCQDGINMFTCDCTPGYTGTNCSIDIDDCSPSPCENGASCQDLVNAYSCYCLTGYSGTNCSVNDDDCASSPCEHGTCHDLVADYSCTCSAGYSGKDCEIDIDECQVQPCQNNGNCIDLVNAYSCSCTGGFEGDNCEVDIDECASDPCDNGGTCEDEQNGYRCLCAVGFIGTNCEQNPSPDFDFVMDGSSASYAAVGNIPDLSAFTLSFWMKTSDQKLGTPVSYVMDTWTSKRDNLLALTDYGSFDLYVNGEAAYTMVAANVGEWIHVCVTWQSSDGSWQVFLNGNLEKTGTDLATGQVIQGGGTLVLGQMSNPSVSSIDIRRAFAGQLSRLNLYSTVLSPADINALAQGCSNELGTLRGWTDFLSRLGTTTVQDSPSYCRDVDECEEEDICSGYGIHELCVNTVGAYNCTCAPGYTGENCSQLINFCESLPCQNGALCNWLVNGYSCKCINGWAGKNCSEVANFCESNPCKNGRTCKSSSAGYICECASTDCESTDLCDGIQCENGGTCDSSSGSCTCPQGFEGKHCGLIEYDPCKENPCLNDGTCEVTSDGYNCHCVGNNETDNCEEPDVCSSNPCQNNGTCARNGTQRDTFICGCMMGTEGDLCETITDYCAPNPCQNEARCVSKTFEGVNCICPGGFTGTYCESQIDVCTDNQEQNMCQNGGTAFENGTTCDCLCPNDLSACTDRSLYGGFTPTCGCSKCSGGDDEGEALYCWPDSGRCVVNEDSQSACQCKQGYHGKHCGAQDEQVEFCNTFVTLDMRYRDIEGRSDDIMLNMGSRLANKTRDTYTLDNRYESWRINATYKTISEGPEGKAVVELALTFTIPPEHGGEYEVQTLKEVLETRDELGGFDRVSVQMDHECPVEPDNLLVVYIAVGCVGVVVLTVVVVLAWYLKKKNTGLYSRPSSRIGPSPSEHIYEDIASIKDYNYQNQAYVDRQHSMRMNEWLSNVNPDARPQYENDDQQSERPSTSMSRPRYDNESEGGSSVDLKSSIYPTSDVFTVVQPGGRSMDPAGISRLYPNVHGSVTPSDVHIPMKRLYPDI